MISFAFAVVFGLLVFVYGCEVRTNKKKREISESI